MRLHVIEPGGAGGIHQHAIELATRVAPHFESVTFHTRRGDDLDWGTISESRCNCFVQRRKSGSLARVFDSISLIGTITRHLTPAIHRGEVVHVHGAWRSFATTSMIVAGRLRGATVFYSPHNTFARSDSRIAKWALKLSVQLSSHVFVYAESDLKPIRSMGQQSVSLIPLVVLIPLGFEEHSRKWRIRWAGLPRPLALAAGVVRQDKRYDILIRAIHDSRQRLGLAVVGVDAGKVTEWAKLADSLGIDAQWFTGYSPLSEFVGAMAAADVVVCPYDRASQSAILAIARHLGVPTIASNAGGLAELADRTFPPGDVAALAELLDQTLVREESESIVRSESSVIHPSSFSDYREIVQGVAGMALGHHEV